MTLGEGIESQSIAPIEAPSVTAGRVPGIRRGPGNDDEGAAGAAPSSGSDARRRRTPGVAQWKLSPQAQLPCAFGLSIENPYLWMESSKSIEAPSR